MTTIKVTKEDIVEATDNYRNNANGILYDQSRECPIACAAKRVWPGEQISVQRGYMSAKKNIFDLPEVASNFIVNWDGWVRYGEYDKAEALNPFEFEVD